MSTGDSNTPKQNTGQPARERRTRPMAVPRNLQTVIPGGRIPPGGFTPRQRRLIRAYHVRSSAGTALLIIATVLLIVRLLALALAGSNNVLVSDGFGAVMLQSTLYLIFSLLIPMVLVIIFYRLGNQRVAGRHQPTGSLSVLAALAGIPVGLIFVGLNNILAITSANQRWTILPRYSLLTLTPDSVLSVLLMVLVLAVLPALLEEIAFRGVIQTGLGVTGRNGLAVLLQALAFTLYYPWGAHPLVVFILGLSLGYLRLRSDSLALAVLTRLISGITILALNRLLPLATSTQNLRGATGQSLLYASVVAAVVATLTLVPLLALIFSFNEREQRQAAQGSAWISSHQRVLVPVQDRPQEAVESQHKQTQTPRYLPPENEETSSEKNLPAAAGLWFISDWKFNLGLVLLVIVALLR